MVNQILVVDDNPSDLMLTSALVEQLSFLPVQASGGFEAIDIVSDPELKFKLLIVDLQMPQMSGIELIKRFRRIQSLQEVPILVTSARKADSDVKSAISAGARDYMVKPIDAQVFEAKVQLLTGGSSGWREYDVSPDSPLAQLHIGKPTRLVSFSELGATLMLDEAVEKDASLNLSGMALSSTAGQFLTTKVTSCTTTPKGNLVKVSFAGLTEEQRKIIRLNCRTAWQEAKQE